MHGVVYRWNDDRGFGFITQNNDDGAEDLSCHVSQITDGSAMQEGMQVSSDVSSDDRRQKYIAQNVTGGRETFDSRKMSKVSACDLQITSKSRLLQYFVSLNIEYFVCRPNLNTTKGELTRYAAKRTPEYLGHAR